MTRRRLHHVLREAAATVFAAAFLIGLLALGSVFGQVS